MVINVLIYLTPQSLFIVMDSRIAFLIFYLNTINKHWEPLHLRRGLLKIYYVQGRRLACLVGFIRKSAYLNIFCVTVNRVVGRFPGLGARPCPDALASSRWQLEAAHILVNIYYSYNILRWSIIDKGKMITGILASWTKHS